MSVRLETARLRLTAVSHDDAPDLLAYFERNAERLRPWEPTASPESGTVEYWERFARASEDVAAAGRGLRLLARTPDAAEIVARVGLSEIVRGVFQAAYLSYSVDGAYAGRGYAREAVGAVVAHAFGELKLHRVMANYRPENARSEKLLRALGFEREGFARDYLFIDGAWRNHVLTARTNPAYAGP